MREEGRVNQSEFKPRKPYDQLSKSGKKLRRLRERDPERYEERKRKKRERMRERLRQMREEDPGAYQEYLKRCSESHKRHPETQRRKSERRRERYQTDPEYRAQTLAYKRDNYHERKESNPESHQRQQRVNTTYIVIYERVVRIELINRRGSACERCSCDDIRCLEAHHKNGDKSEDPHGDYIKMLRGEMEYEVLCANCHKAGVHPQEQLGSAHSSIYYRGLRNELFLRRGGTCERCSCDDLRCLELHHGNGDSSERRRDDLRKMRDGEIEYEVLCANCHKIKHYEPPEVMPLTPRQAEMLLQVKAQV